MQRVSQTTHLNLEYIGYRAGIAQLVEQATENRRVPSSNLGPGTFKPLSKTGVYTFKIWGLVIVCFFLQFKVFSFPVYRLDQ